MNDRDELREKVADAIAKAWDDEGRVMHAADAAIAVALEEAARVCDEDAQRSGWLVAAQLGLAEDEKLAFHQSAAKALQLAAAIRGMKG